MTAYLFLALTYTNLRVIGITDIQVSKPQLFFIRKLCTIFAAMDFKCFVCKDLFPTQKVIITHLKKDHFVKENEDPIYCLKNNKCKQYFLNFRHLKDHLKICPLDIDQQVKINESIYRLELGVHFSFHFHFEQLSNLDLSDSEPTNCDTEDSPISNDIYQSPEVCQFSTKHD